MHDTNLLEDQPIAWTPTPDVIERAQLTKFMRQVGVSTWDELYEFSIRDVEKFTQEVLKFLDIRFDPPYDKLLDTSNGIEFPIWLQGSPPVLGGVAAASADGVVPRAGLNITEMCLDRWDDVENRGRDAIVWRPEDPNEEGEDCSYGELIQDVQLWAAGLRDIGIKKGDAIGLHLPMIPETIISLLAINRIGAIAVPVFSGYGVEAVASRLQAVNAVALFAATGFPRRGKMVDSLSVSVEAARLCPSLKHLFVVENYGPMTDREIELPGVIVRTFLDIEPPPTCAEDDVRRQAEPTSAEDPLIILYTSGTTGKPKGIAHTHASFPIKAAQDMAFGTDVGKGTRICWYTDIGWMMGPWLIYGALINGATICIYDGAPDYPTPDRMWEFCAKHKIEILGISPTLIRALSAHEGSALSSDTTPSSQSLGHPSLDKEGSKKEPYERHDLSSLRMFASTGEPWNPAPWWWLFEKVGKSKLPIINYSGGTEIAGGILMGNPLLPQKPCSFPAPCPGMDVDILNENGESVNPGEVGELVIKQPWIGMARGFWQEKERYLETYWRRFKDIWVHGDWAMRDKDGHWFILGRSDDTLKVAGKRVGPAEVESLLVAHPLVTEAAVIGVPDEVKGTAMVAFCVLNSSTQSRKEAESPEKGFPPYKGGVAAASADGVVLHDSSPVTHHSSLQQELKTLVAKDMGKPLAPSKIHFVSALPKTRNAKVMRRVIRSAYLGEDPGDLSALENPQAVEEIQQLTS